jgi:hypothetical protein
VTRRKAAVFAAVYVAWTGLIFAVLRTRPRHPRCGWWTCGPHEHFGWGDDLGSAAVLALVLTSAVAWITTIRRAGVDR